MQLPGNGANGVRKGTIQRWEMCGRCLKHHPFSELAPCEASYRGARRILRICIACRGRLDHERWLFTVVGRARYLALQREKGGDARGRSLELAVNMAKGVELLPEA